MKIKFVKINHDQKFVHNKKVVNVGDVIDLPKERAVALVMRGVAEAVKEAPKNKNESKDE
ncbi:hypothetical protein [Cytobacillus pseudoceanisediminis]|jgi:hypothetical protein|uniref:hypothetical protein n=1 Tax=Cytobacillus pseudoceanisediminis TaxID=3051614 RepID=UPI003CF9287F